MQDFFSYDADGLRALLESWGQPAYRARQLCEWVWQRGASSYEEMTNLPATLREQLAVEAPLRRATVVRRLEAGDGTRKYLLELADGVRVETVAIPNVRQGVRQGDGSVRQGGETGVRQGDGSLVSCAHETREPSPCLTPVSPPCLTEPSPCLTPCLTFGMATVSTRTPSASSSRYLRVPSPASRRRTTVARRSGASTASCSRSVAGRLVISS